MRSVLFIVAVTIFVISLPIWLLAPPLFKSAPRSDEELLQQWNFSEPGRAGLVAFSMRCADCHGQRAQGTDRAPSLLDRTYSADFREAPAFHSTFDQPIRAHQAFSRIANGSERPRFNDIELLGKFLREARRFDKAEQ